jgi:hypothetical protein
LIHRMNIRGNLIGLAALLYAAFVSDKWISARLSIPADVTRQSDFLRIYDPAPLLNSFLAGCRWRAGVESEVLASPGYRFLNTAEDVSYTRTDHSNLCDRNQYPLAVAALHRSTLSALRYFGCKVSSDKSGAGAGVRIVYRCGTRTTGLVTTGPADKSAFVTLRLDEEWSVRSPS